jgi:hypothetical protein
LKWLERALRVAGVVAVGCGYVGVVVQAQWADGRARSVAEFWGAVPIRWTRLHVFLSDRDTPTPAAG